MAAGPVASARGRAVMWRTSYSRNRRPRSDQGVKWPTEPPAHVQVAPRLRPPGFRATNSPGPGHVGPVGNSAEPGQRVERDGARNFFLRSGNAQVSGNL